MKKALCIAALIACIVVSVCGAFWIADRAKDELWAWYDAGFDDGISYALETYGLQDNYQATKGE